MFPLQKSHRPAWQQYMDTDNDEKNWKLVSVMMTLPQPWPFFHPVLRTSSNFFLAIPTMVMMRAFLLLREGVSTVQSTLKFWQFYPQFVKILPSKGIFSFYKICKQIHTCPPPLSAMCEKHPFWSKVRKSKIFYFMLYLLFEINSIFWYL